MSNMRKFVRENLLPSHKQIGSEGIHEDLHVDATRGNVDYTPSRDNMGMTGSIPDPITDPIQHLSDAIRRIDSGYNSDTETIELIQRLVDTKLIEYMSDEVRSIATKLYDEGAITMTEDIGNSSKNPAHTTADIKVKGNGPVNKETGGEKVKKPEGLNQQQAHGVAKIPNTGGSTNITSVGHQEFPDSDGKGENPAGIPDAEGKQKAGVVTGDSTKTQGMKVGNSIYQAGSKDTDKDKEYHGSKVGSVKESTIRRVLGNR